MNKETFDLYFPTPAHFASVWHQAKAIMDLKPKTVLEVGIGSGATAEIVGNSQDLFYKAEDLPDCDIRNLPFRKASFDVSCAFQVLEHMPFHNSMSGFRELSRVSNNHIIISLPNQQRRKWLHWPRRFFPDGIHHWEIGSRDYSLKKVIRAFEVAGDCECIKEYRLPERPYHHMMIFRKMGVS